MSLAYEDSTGKALEISYQSCLFYNEECTNVHNNYVASSDSFKMSFRKKVLLFQLLLRTKDSYGLVLGKDDTLPTDSYIESYPNQLKSYYLSRIRNTRVNKLSIIFYKLYH